MDRLKELLEADQVGEFEKKARKTIDSEQLDEVEVYAFTIEGALHNAADILGVSIVNLEYQILERGSNGVLGFGKKPYRILVKLSTNSVPGMEDEDELALGDAVENTIVLDQDGSFKVLVRKKGVMLRVNPPRGSGKPVEYGMILSELTQRMINNFDENVIRREVAKPSGEYARLGDYIPSQNDSIFQVSISPDKMKVFLTITKPEKFGRILEVEEVLLGMKANNVIFGAKDNVIEDAINNELYNMPILVAEGEPPQEGKDAEIKFYFKINSEDAKYNVGDNGSVDFHKLDLFQSVVVDQVLAAKMPAERGKPGKTVNGIMIMARDGRDIKLTAGKNTHLAPDGSQLVADINGQVVFKNNVIHVEPVLEINGDVDLSTGDINYPGNVVIFGSINDTFKVMAGGNIEVRGGIGKAEVVAEGNVIVRAGIQGKNEGTIICEGDLFARFVEQTKLRVKGDIFITEVLLHSQVDCKGNIILTGGKRSQIAGGMIRALKEINAKFLGAEAYTETILESGIDPDAENKLTEVIRRRDEINKEMTEMNKQLTQLGMLLSTGPLPPEKEELHQNLSLKNLELKEELSALSEQIDTIQQYLDTLGKDGKISASKIVYPGVKIKIKTAVLPVKSEFKFVSFRKEGPEIKIVPYEKPRDVEEKLKNAGQTQKKAPGK